jgi:flagellar secretion chaperone FliS
MTPTNAQAMSTYRSVYVGTAAEDASPHGLVVLLFDAARIAVHDARLQMQLKQIAAKGAAIGKACEIIDDGLKASLDMEHGGKIAEQLSSLYDYMVERLTLANLRNEPTHLDEVGRLLAEIEAAWREIAPPAPAAQTAVSSRGPASGSYSRA